MILTTQTSSSIILEGRIEFWCPVCMTKDLFYYMSPPICKTCDTKLPNFRHLLAVPNVRLRFCLTGSTKIPLRVSYDDEGNISYINRQTGKKVSDLSFAIEGD